MAQFDVVKNTNRSTKTLYPYLVEIQSNLLSDLQTTVVVPLILAKNYPGTPISKLHPAFRISGKNYISIMPLVAGIDRSSIGEKATSLTDSRDEIIAALDFLITGI